MSQTKLPETFDIGSTIDCSAEELDRMRRRREIRTRLQAEYNRFYYNPFRHVYRVAYEDPAVNRFQAARASFINYWKPSWRTFFQWSSFTFVPIGLVFIGLTYDRYTNLLAVQSGQTRYEERDHKMMRVGTMNTAHHLMS